MQAYPLQWPAGWPRTPSLRRKKAQFGVTTDRMRPSNGSIYKAKIDLTMDEAVLRLHDELTQIGVKHINDVVISTNVELTLSGRPRAGAEPVDPGVAVYWQIKNSAPRVIAIDAYTRIRDNIAAIAATLNAMRAIARHGGAVVMERAFTGFDALPAPKKWWEVLGVAMTASVDEINQRFRELAAKHHPDRGGSHERMAEISRAREEALAEMGIVRT